MTEGWTFLVNATKWHYFRNSRSLCGKWMYLGDDADLEQGKLQSPDNCEACRKRRIRELAKENKKIAKSWSVWRLTACPIRPNGGGVGFKGER